MKKLICASFFLLLVTQISFAQWYQQYTYPGVYLNAVYFIDSNNGWVAGGGGMIIYTNDAGVNWQQQVSGTPNSLNDLCFIDNNSGYAIGDNGTILKTTNGGIDWTQLPSGTQTNLNGMCIINSDNIWVVGGDRFWPNDFSIILNTTDGGMNWTQWVYEDTTSLNDIYFTDINNGYAVGWKPYPNYEGIILRTTNGGTDWIHQISGTRSSINAVQFIDSNTGWAVGGTVGTLPKNVNDSSYFDPGLVLKTVDGGNNWIKQLDTLYCPLYGISLLNGNMGFVAGGYTCMGTGCAEGRILNTIDGGTNWICQVDSIGYAFSDVFFTDSNNGWLVGLIAYPWAGVVFHTTNGGVPVELSSFTATTNGNEVILNWSTATELNNQGFEIQRSREGDEFFTVGFTEGHGTTTEQHNYTYSDKLLDNGKYYYRLKQVDFDGSYEYSDIVEVDFAAFNSYLLEQNYPNPFNPTTTISFNVAEKSNVKITILNTIGEEVAVVLNGEKEAGYHQVEFNAANLPSGVYFYQLEAVEFISTKKMILLK